jgi:choline dehydrogenase-like flavoprotein
VIIDGLRQPGGLSGTYDACVIGAGPAGLAIAERLADRGRRVVIIEAGSTRPTMRNQRMLVDRPSGSPYWNLENVRFRMLGGSGSRWGGICRPLDPLDLADRPWVENSGWPIGWADLTDYYRQAARLLELADDDFEQVGATAGAWSPAVPPGSDFEVAHFRLSPKIDFGSDYRAVLAGSANVSLITNTNVTALHLRANSDVIASVETRTFGGGRDRVRAGLFVLATGGIENARLLLASPGRHGGALGNEHDVVGRYFMEHVHAEVATLVPSDAVAQWSSYDLATWPRLTNALVPTAEAQQAGELLNASVAVGPNWYVGDPPFARRDYRLMILFERLQRIQAASDGRVTGRLLDQLRAPFRRLMTRDVPTRGDERVRSVVYRGEQPPRRDNRVVLSKRTDEFGRPLAHLQWAVRHREMANADAVLELFGAAVEANGWGTLSAARPGWRDKIIGGPHHLGTTRMADDPRFGVVDRDCRVHSVDNLYVAGSSVFATGGHANPTLTVVALSLRLADRLADRLGEQLGSGSSAS